MGLHDIESMKPGEFTALADLVRSRIGLHLREEKKTLVESRLARRVRALGIGSYGAYIEMLSADPRSQEFSELSNVLTTNVTAFFREAHHFDLLKSLAQEEFAPRIDHGEEIRLWSAGCSTGAEAYSMAMTLHAALGANRVTRLRILASDIDRAVLQKAEAARYSPTEAEGIPDDKRSAYTETRGQQIVMRDDIRAMVSFRQLNLIEPWPMRKPFDVIFCRNVVIYFDAKTQDQLWARFAKQLGPGGRLCIGHSERLSRDGAALFRSIGVTAYRKS